MQTFCPKNPRGKKKKHKKGAKYITAVSTKYNKFTDITKTAQR